MDRPPVAPPTTTFLAEADLVEEPNEEDIAPLVVATAVSYKRQAALLLLLLAIVAIVVGVAVGVTVPRRLHARAAVLCRPPWPRHMLRRRHQLRRLTASFGPSCPRGPSIWCDPTPPVPSTRPTNGPRRKTEYLKVRAPMSNDWSE